MKALLASLLTALVLVTTAWASNVTPAQLGALTKRVAQLERQNAGLSKRLTAIESYDKTCLNAFTAVTEHGLSVDNGDGTTTAGTFLARSGPSEKPDYWIATVPDRAPCVSAP